ncbi:Exocyst complex component S5 [Recurvomyces mirabilis]|nr:Exocyst complex component S5 [Recurvomyces mirabilis]
MSLSAETESRLLNKYKLTTLYPDTWPHKDESSDDEDEDGQQQLNGGAVQAGSKYRNIDRHASIRSTGSIGPDSIVQKDEPDPLGMAPSVAAELRKRGVPVEDDLRLRNRFMLSSTSFSPALFLSQVHQEASTEDLLRGLDYLSRSIEQKSASLKVLVESNFEKFVKAKSTIDNVYTEMRTQGADAEAPATPNMTSPGGRRAGHSRLSSRSQTHFRNTSGPFSPTLGAIPAVVTAKKNALTRESEYGVLGIKVPLQEVAIKAEEVWGPAIGGREKEETLKSVLGALEQYQETFKLGSVVHEAVKKNDYDTVIDGWRKANRGADQARQVADLAQRTGVPIGEQDAQQILIQAKAYHDVSTQVETFKRDVWRRLKSNHGRKPAAVADEADKEEHLELIGVLLQLGVDENPIWQWLNSRSLYLKDKIARSFERARIEIEIQRRRLAANDKQDARQLAQYLRSASNTGSLLTARDSVKEMDTPAVLAFWEQVLASFRSLLSPQNGLLAEVLDFWSTTQSFIDGKAQNAFSGAVLSAGTEHLELEPDDVANLRESAIALVTQLREAVMGFFADAPVEDLSELYSPIPPTPITPDSAGSKTPGGSGAVRRTFTFDAQAVPPPSPMKGEAWEKFAFWPPYANSLSGAHYLSLLLTVVGTAAAELAGLEVVKQSKNTEALKSLVSAVRERSIAALCSALATDADRTKYLELWHRAPDRRDLTTMPEVFRAWEERVLVGFQRIAYVSEVVAVRGTRGTKEVVVPPPQKLVQVIRGTVVTSFWKMLSGMVEGAERDGDGKGVGGVEGEGVVVEGVGGGEGGGEGGGGVLDARNKNIRILMTLSNLSHLRAEVIPHLISAFETNFTVTLTDDTKTIRDALGQIDARLFQSYVRPTIDFMSIQIHDGINSPSWAPAKPTTTTTPLQNASPYIYTLLLHLVLLHTEITTTTSVPTHPLLAQIMTYLLEKSSSIFLSTFQTAYQHYTLPMLMQATLDVEFWAQTLQLFTSEKAAEVQSQVYLALDERTDEKGRGELQGELGGMRAVLKGLREGSKGTFGCFKKERRGRDGGGAGGRGGGGGGGSARASGGGGDGGGSGGRASAQGSVSGAGRG